MKKLILSAAIVLGSLSTITASASTVNPTVKSVTIADEYTEIKIEELPAAITEALKKAYPDAVLTKAYINESKQYKLDLKVGDKEGSLFADESGNWIQE
ncbi:hypothetical protein ACRASX_03855 [Flavobacterium sp. TMP13]|uniref:hypothetical protein n=1 Tax=unclassified Flavobacterium TaxID=196869 RepID=UPI00076C94C9|nr:hypothetical protein [Flavobacterium sp. TAB 87]KVV13227.1 hypothetical protein AP058_02589 [Flavobacterium sp. TAB 87]